MATIANRVKWANAAIEEYRRLTRTDSEDAVCDLVCDLMHWALAHKQNPTREIERGIAHNYSETHVDPEEGEEGLGPDAIAEITVYPRGNY